MVSLILDIFYCTMVVFNNFLPLLTLFKDNGTMQKLAVLPVF